MAEEQSDAVVPAPDDGQDEEPESEPLTPEPDITDEPALRTTVFFKFEGDAVRFDAAEKEVFLWKAGYSDILRLIVIPETSGDHRLSSTVTTADYQFQDKFEIPLRVGRKYQLELTETVSVSDKVSVNKSDTGGASSAEISSGGATLKEISPLRHVLWVDDNPSNITSEIDILRKGGMEVIEALSTDEAMTILASRKLEIDVIISDMGRREETTYRRKAGLTLIKAVRKEGIQIPIFVYTSEQAVTKNYKDILEAGGNGATSSPVELFEMLSDF